MPIDGSDHGSCPGYIADHVAPLWRGGADAVKNMQWQSNQEAQAKDYAATSGRGVYKSLDGGVNWGASE